MAFGKWKTVGMLVSLPSGELFVVPAGGSGRLIYEEYDPITGLSNGNSTFYSVNTLNVVPSTDTADEGVEGHLKLNLSDDSATKLGDDD